MTKPALPPAIATAPAASSSSRGITSEQPKPRNDDTLKPSDRRFYLQQAGSPDGSSPQETPRTTSAKSSDVQERSPSSTSSHIKSEAAGHASKRGSGQARKSKEVVRHAPGPTAEPKKTTFNIGSVSSNGSRSATGAPSKPAPHKETVAANPPPNPPNEINGAGPPRRGVVISTSSEYETDTDDDSEWASEDEAAEAGEKERRAREEARLREAAEEAQRQRDMFAKVPKRSYSNLNRTRSGLLSQLLNPDPNLFPPNHPYRNSFSTQDMTMLGRHGGGFTPIVTAQAPPTHVNGNGGYRPKGRPQGEELEDDSDSGEENTDNEIQLSRSIAQQKLAALADPNRRRYSDRGPSHHHQPVRPSLPSVATAPIPLGHPYNLPAPAPPMTPRTTRRQMLSTELSESLRRNLLWERQVSKINMTARRGVLGGGLRPLTAANPAANTSAANQHGRVNGGERADDREESKRRAMRNRSWADDYHYAGW
ncbi:hypothetical protein A0H81_13861 [Grifola frondosa]|uniref:DUF3295 domain-containing protein n=1 Tax=Grifola frondosa TaxID=5627 RepID=A0A1C7LQN1_GRIFR|nr:hypothetical protein A0H81_13861 [Grifola frondosa]